MKVEVRYLDALPFARGYRYAFDVPDGTRVGDQFLDGQKIVEVTALDSSYDGPIRRLGWIHHQPSQTPGDASTPASATSHGARRNREGTN